MSGTRRRRFDLTWLVQRDLLFLSTCSGIMALMATAEYYDAAEIATRILPHLVVLTVDSDGYRPLVHTVPQFGFVLISCRFGSRLHWSALPLGTQFVSTREDSVIISLE